jgi:hypothetical protein
MRTQKKKKKKVGNDAWNKKYENPILDFNHHAKKLSEVRKGEGKSPGKLERK